ncbi:CHAD domain-containing protein [Diaminobutyricibacter tongyongensis]|uniref:CHAD domain-containing protein n=1 Tax=Leifsonia tongyongensis TaxID=1268043 RepID=A0A6L9XZ58_9MICO|nr:CHAD domain-containing protein [Diaminobutyricibacter tongyongensis]NEN06703.1 CHAD domain-containing protein [Diaminobutyricibacter tongyongensis]
MEVDTAASAGDAIIRILVFLDAELRVQLEAVRRDEPDSVHQARIRVRRIRSVLAVYRRLFDRTQTDDLRQDLRALGAALGTARDPEVRAKTTEDLLLAHTAPAVIDAVESLAGQSRDEHRDARRGLLALFDSAEHAALLDRLTRFAVDPPLHPHRAQRPARRSFRQALRREVGRVDERARAAADLQLDALHELRKKVRRLRYAADAVSSEPVAVLGARTQRLAYAAETAQDVLGDHRDGILLARHLRRAIAGHALNRSAATGVGIFAARCERQANRELERLDVALDGIRELYA